MSSGRERAACLLAARIESGQKLQFGTPQAVLGNDAAPYSAAT